MTVYPGIEALAELCRRQFESLPKSGKPTQNEWSVLAGVVQHCNARLAGVPTTQVVALGAGTKCVGGSQLCPRGLKLHDSHAEVLVRRSLLRYFYHELRQADGQPDASIFQWNDADVGYQLREGITFHFFCSQTPCGDACILPTATTTPTKEAEEGKPEEEDEPTAKKLKKQAEEVEGSEELVYTGAKLLAADGDRMQQTIGSLRTKPGRGDRTLSMSCSDKLAKWMVLGVQGCLLDAVLLRPIYMETMNFRVALPEHGASIERALYGRWAAVESEDLQLNAKFALHRPEIRANAVLRFPFDQDEQRTQPSPNGLIWCKIDAQLKPYEVTVNGKRQGITSKKAHTPEAAAQVSKYHLMRQFVGLLRAKPQLQSKLGLADDTDLLQLTYKQCKELSREYRKSWSRTKDVYFGGWSIKPDTLNDFRLEAEGERKEPKKDYSHK